MCSPVVAPWQSADRMNVQKSQNTHTRDATCAYHHHYRRRMCSGNFPPWSPQQYCADSFGSDNKSQMMAAWVITFGAFIITDECIVWTPIFNDSISLLSPFTSSFCFVDRCRLCAMRSHLTWYLHLHHRQARNGRICSRCVRISRRAFYSRSSCVGFARGIAIVNLNYNRVDCIISGSYGNDDSKLKMRRVVNGESGRLVGGGWRFYFE